MWMRVPENAPHNPDELLEHRDGLEHLRASGAVGLEKGPSVQCAQLERNIMFGSQLLPSNGYDLARKRPCFAESSSLSQID